MSMRNNSWWSRRFVALTVLVVCATISVVLAGCSTPQGETQTATTTSGQGTADMLADDLGSNRSKLFSYIDGVDELASPLCVIVSEGGTCEFLQSDKLPLAEPSDANALLLVVLNAKQDENGDPTGAYTCVLTYGNKDASTAVCIADDVELESREALADMLSKNYSFVDGDPKVFSVLAEYDAQLAERDYASAIDKCRDDYGDKKKDGALKASDLVEPLVYLVDEDCVCEAVGDNDLIFPPAEDKQYVPSGDGAYQRPEIGGSISVGFATLGKRPSGDGGKSGDKAYYTIEDIEGMVANPSDAFCFSEVVGKKPYGTFSSKSTGESFTASSYVMRLSLISLDGELIGYKDLAYDQDPSNDTLGFNAQIIAMSLTKDKNGDVVFPWGYKDEIWKEL